MSTFDGKVAEFPDIRIDYFRLSDSNSKPPLAFFLSHVHSDHLTGLESCKSPFIYCSPATRDILLRLEKYPHRMNFAKGILESRKQTYRHLKNLLKAIPLETPTVIELSPGNEIRVTLLDANHCVGAVMFLVEGQDNAILYSGDIRSELWWVNTLRRNPIMLPYVCSQDTEPLKKLDGLYLDTTFVVTGREDPYKDFPSKADGIMELLQQVSRYPQDTLFYFDAWTFGYEDVWQALSNFLSSQIHVDEYRYGLYRALVNGIEPKALEGVSLIGFPFGNHFQNGCLTSTQCRLHSCERGTGCEVWNKDFVRITPIISRHDGVEMAELGAGGGQGDLNRQHELEIWDTGLVGQLMALCATKLQGQPQLLSSVVQMLSNAISVRAQSVELEGFNLMVNPATQGLNEDHAPDFDELPLGKLVPALVRLVTKAKQKKTQTRPQSQSSKRLDGLPKQITFPYSRHSSYSELCGLVEAFKPKNIYPCTVDESSWSHSSSMAYLFGHTYSEFPLFAHDIVMLQKKGLSMSDLQQDIRPSSSGSMSSGYATAHEAANAPHRIVRERGEVMKKEGQEEWGLEAEDRRKARLAQLEETDKGRKEREAATTTASPSHDQTLSNIISTLQGVGHRKRNIELDKASSRKVTKLNREAQGDFRPPINVDHYSPPRERKRHKHDDFPNFSPPQTDSKDDHHQAPWLPLGKVGTQPSSPLRERWLKRIAETTAQEQPENYRPTKKIGHRRRSSDYGRLTPPTGGMLEKNMAKRDASSGLDRAQALLDESKPSRPSSSGTELSTPRRLALRREAYNAARGAGDFEWTDIGLVSVNGHQTKEEEL